MVNYVFMDLTKLRETAGLSRAKLARETGLDRGTIVRLEDGLGGRKENLISIFNALNRLHYQAQGKPLVQEECVISS